MVGDELVWSCGSRATPTSRPSGPTTRTTLFRIASITKTFTATAILQLRDEGKLHLDDPAVAYLPELRDAQSPFGPIETVTIRRMLSHESGLMGDPPGARWFHDVYESSTGGEPRPSGRDRDPHPAQRAAEVLEHRLPAARRDRRAPRAAGRTPAYVRERILDPLGMTSSGFAPLPAELAARRAVGYWPRWLSDVFEPAVGLSEFPAAEGGLQSCVEDVARWLSAQFPMEDAPEGHRTVLADATLREMQRPRYLEGDTWEEAWCIGVVRGAQGRDRLGAALGRAARLHHERVLPIEGAGGRDRAAERRRAMRRAWRWSSGCSRSRPPGRRWPPVKLPTALPEGYEQLLGFYGEPTEAILARLEWRDGKLTMLDPSEADWKLVLLPAGASPTGSRWTGSSASPANPSSSIGTTPARSRA